MARVIAHVDMDAFFAAIEQRDNPALRGQPVIVGSPPSQRGVVCAASYEARRFGVRSAMPSATAARLCPQGIFIRPRMDVYQAESGRIRRLLEETGGVVEPTSIDEAYLDWSALCPAQDPDEALEQAVPLARALKQRIRQQCGLTASVGLAANKLLAKLASDWQKPDGLTVISERDKVALLRPLPVRVLPGVGPATERLLHQAGLRTLGEVQDHPSDLRELLGAFGPTVKRFAFGQDDRPLDLSDEVKSISCEETFLRDTADRPQLRACLRAQAAEIADKLQRRRLAARTVQVKVRYGDFTTLTRQITVQDPVTEATELYRLGCWLLARDRLVCRPLRLLGLGVSNLTDATVRQLRLL